MAQEGQLPTRVKHGAWRAALRAVSGFEAWIYDFRAVRLYEHAATSPNLTILQISDNSLAKIGHWPWPRSTHGELLDRLSVYGAKVVMFDALFPEPQSPENDRAFADAIQRFSTKGGAVVVGYNLADGREASLKDLPEAMFSSMVSGSILTPLGEAYGVDRNNFANPTLAASSVKFGFITVNLDEGGVLRRVRLVSEANGLLVPSLALAGFQFFLLSRPGQIVKITQTSGSYHQLVVKREAGSSTFRLGTIGEHRLRYFGRANNFNTLPIEKVLQDASGGSDPELKTALAGKAILIGSAALGAHDLRNLPNQTMVPGYLAHANVFHALDQGFLFKPWEESLLISLAFLVLFQFLSVFVAGRMGFGASLIIMSSLFALLGGVDFLVFTPQGFMLWLGPAAVTALVLLVWTVPFAALKRHEGSEQAR